MPDFTASTSNSIRKERSSALIATRRATSQSAGWSLTDDEGYSCSGIRQAASCS